MAKKQPPANDGKKVAAKKPTTKKIHLKEKPSHPLMRGEQPNEDFGEGAEWHTHTTLVIVLPGFIKLQN